MSKPIRILIIDDSAFVRKVVKEMLSRGVDIEVVGTARDGLEALELVEELKPDVVTCDLIMPRMDGVSFVREQMSRRAVPILILTAAPEDGERALEALAAGAVEIVQKPTALATDEIRVIEEELIGKIKAIAQIASRHLHPEVEGVRRVVPAPHGKVKTKIVVIGISTGGPQALRYMLPRFPADFPVPIAVVLHMPIGYTAMFAQKLNELARLEVKEAEAGDKLESGRILIARAGRHLALRTGLDGGVFAELPATPKDSPHIPSVDVLFQSAAKCYGRGVLGIVMTGMGDDGKGGAAWIKSQGGTVITESESSCVIYGMPRSVVEAGLSDRAVPLNKMVETIMEKL